MPAKSQRGGVPVCQYPVPQLTKLIASFANVTVTPTLVSLDDELNTSPETPLPTDTYQVHVGMLAYDKANKGYTIGACSELSPGVALSLTEGQAIKIKILSADIPASARNGAAAAVFLKRGSTNPQLAGYFVMPTSGDFIAYITTLPSVSAPFFTSAVLSPTTLPTTNAENAGAGVVIEMASTAGLTNGDTIVVTGLSGGNLISEVTTITALVANTSITATLANTYSAAMEVFEAQASDAILGSRLAYEYLYVTLGPTTGGVQHNYRKDNVEFRPDNSGNYRAPTTSSAPISTRLLPNVMREIIRAAGGLFAKGSDSGKTVEVGRLSWSLAATVFNGNIPLRLVYPSSKGGQEVSIHLDRTVSNPEEVALSWQKDQAVTIPITFEAAAQDELLDSVNNEARYVIY